MYGWLGSVRRLDDFWRMRSKQPMIPSYWPICSLDVRAWAMGALQHRMIDIQYVPENKNKIYNKCRGSVREVCSPSHLKQNNHMFWSDLRKWHAHTRTRVICTAPCVCTAAHSQNPTSPGPLLLIQKSFGSCHILSNIFPAPESKALWVKWLSSGIWPRNLAESPWWWGKMGPKSCWKSTKFST